MFGIVISLVGGPRGPVPTELALGLTTFKPVKSHVHGLDASRDNSIVDDAHGGGVIGLDRGGRLGPSHFFECLSYGDHFFGRDEQGGQFSFCCRGHDKLDDLGDGEDGPIECWDGVVIRHEQVSPSSTSCFGLIEVGSIRSLG